MAGISKALEFPAEVVFQRVCNSVEAHHELQSQLNHALQQLFQLSYTLQAHAEQNSTHSQQLQLQAGVTSKVAERLMLAHCEQELAQRARIVSETRATVRLPPFAQVMQQISDHVRQRCLAAATLQAPSSWPVYQGQLQHSGYTTQAAASPFNLPNHQASLIPAAAPQQPSFHPQTEQTGVATAQSLALQMPVSEEPAQHHCSGQQHAAAQTQQAHLAESLPASSLCQSRDSRHCPTLHQHAPQFHSSEQPKANMPIFPACSQPPLQASSVMPTILSASPHSFERQHPQNLAVASRQYAPNGSMHNASTSMPDGSPLFANLVASAEGLQLQEERHLAQQHALLPMMSAAVTSPVTTQLPVLPMSLLSGAPASNSCAQEAAPGSSLVSRDRRHGFQQSVDIAACGSLDGATTLASKQNQLHSLPSVRQQTQQQQQQQQKQQQHRMVQGLTPSHGLLAGLGQQGSAAKAVTDQPCDLTPRAMPTARLSGPARLPGFSVLLQSVEQGQPAVSSVAGDNPATSVHAEALEQSISQQHAPALTTAAPATLCQDAEVPSPAAQASSKVQLSNDARSLPMLCGAVAPIAAAACTGAATSAQLALPVCDALCVKQSTGLSTSPDTGNGMSSLLTVPDVLGASPELVLSEGSFRFQANEHAGTGLQHGVLLTPVLRSRANEEPSVSGRKAPLVSGADDAAHAACASQQEVIIPDSEESPGRCSQQRLQPDPHTSVPLHHVVDAQEPAAAAADPVDLNISQTAEKAESGKMQCKEHVGLSSVVATASASAVSGSGTGRDVDARMHASEQVSSGCSLEVLPMRLPRKTCTHQGHEGQPLQQQQQPQQCQSKDHSRHSGRHLASLASEQDMIEDKAPQGISSAFGTPIAPAPAGPSEHLGDHVVSGAVGDSQFGNTSLAVTAQHGQQSVPGTDARRWPANAQQGASKAHLHDASQPSTSSLKRVPETPDSSENRSQPTQSPCRHERSGSSPRQAGPLRVVLVNNSDEQAGTQGVNVAAFLLMDSQKGSTSPGHPKSAEPLSVLSQAREGAAAHQQAVCNSQTQEPLPASQPQLLNTHPQPAGPSLDDIPHRHLPADASAMHCLQQRQRRQQSVKAKAQTIKQPAQQSMPNSAKGNLPKADPQQAGTNVTAMPAHSDAKQPIKPADAQAKPAAANQASSEPSRWPGSCSQAAVADANALHGVAAVVVRARRSKSCSGSTAMQQHAAKKLMFQQLTLARKPHADSAMGDGKPVQSARQKPLGQAKRIDAHVSSTVTESWLARQEVAEQAMAAMAASAMAAPLVPVAQASPINHKGSRQSALQQSVQQHVHPEGTGQHPERADQQRGLQQKAAAGKQAEGSSEQQWQAAISQLHTLAEKHSQDSQDNADASADGAASAGIAVQRNDHLVVRPLAVTTGKFNQSEAAVPDVAGMPCKLQTAQVDTSSAADQVPAMAHAKDALNDSNPAAVSGALHDDSQAVTQQQRLHKAKAQQASLSQYAAVAGCVGQPETIETAGKASAAAAGPDIISLFRAALHGYPGLSELRQVMPQQRQQHGQNSAEGQARGFAHTNGQISEQGLGQRPRLDPIPDIACRLQGQGQKRKAPEEEPAQGSMHPGHGHDMMDGGSSCKRQHLPAPELAKSGIQPAHTNVQPCSASLSPIKGLQMQEAVHPTAADTAGCARARPCVQPAKTDAQIQVLVKSASDARAGCGVAPAAEVGSEATEAAAVAAPAVVVPIEVSARQDDSQGQPGGLRLDLSSEEDLLLCTQRIPSSQGGSGSGQGLFKTPDDLPPDPKAQAPALVAPHGTLGMLSPWNTPALAQQAPPHPPDSTQHWKLAGSVSPVAGHPAPPLSWMGSHDAGPATGAASKDKSDGNSNKRKRSVSETNVSLANAAAEIQTNVQPCQ
ncbi:MAG: hypothetical protein FRX49_04441 [Trebouxia sp. A1-2]|nr:MAG: hypothetical protein FRX49_04441 [Trebouxia sp. A1-2]